MALVAQLVKDIAQMIRPCPSEVIRGAFTRAARQLCTESRWYQAQYDLTLVAGTRAYEIVPPMLSGQAASQLEVVDLAWEGNWINASLTNDNWIRLGKMGPNYANPNLGLDLPLRVAYTPEGEAAFEPIPDQAYPVRLTVVYQPVDNATDIPDALLVKWREGIEAGALAYLYGITGEPFANPVLSAANGKTFRAAIANAKANVAMAFQSGSRRANPRPFFPQSTFMQR